MNLPPPKPAPMAPAAGLTSELCGAAAAELTKLGAVIKVYGAPITAPDLERMKNGGSQDRREDLIRLTASQLTDTAIFARLLQQFLDGCKAGKYPKGQAVELMGRTVGAPVSQRLVGSSMAPGPKIAQGLRATAGGAAFKAQASGTQDRQLSELVAKCLEGSAETVKTGTLKTEVFKESGLQLERITRHIDAVMVQRVFRDTLRSCKATSGLGMDALRLLSPLADAVEHALAGTLLDSAFTLAAEVAPHVRAAVETHRGAVTTKLAQAGRALDGDLAALAPLAAPKPAGIAPAAANAPAATPLPNCLKAAAAAYRGLDLSEQSGGFTGAVYRRVTVSTAEPVTAALVALGALAEALHAVAAASLPAACAEHSVFRALAAPAPAAAGDQRAATWPPLRAEEIVLLADRVFDANGSPKDALPGGASARGPARTLITLRGDWIARTQMLALCTAALRPGGALQEPKKSEVHAAETFLAGLEGSVREALLMGLYQIAQGDPDQRTRQIGFYLATQATAVLKPGLTLGPLRVGFAKYWRSVEGT
ncbi:MAG: hypothetical protein IT381_24275 [Deltaproteobacteria bacterium]|nr:hypothetical protein [Deltaproteobacteria bacterium]